MQAELNKVTLACDAFRARPFVGLHDPGALEAEKHQSERWHEVSGRLVGNREVIRLARVNLEWRKE
jgi:hypothetical protein